MRAVGRRVLFAAIMAERREHRVGHVGEPFGDRADAGAFCRVNVEVILSARQAVDAWTPASAATCFRVMRAGFAGSGMK